MTKSEYVNESVVIPYVLKHLYARLDVSKRQLALCPDHDPDVERIRNKIASIESDICVTEQILGKHFCTDCLGSGGSNGSRENGCCPTCQGTGIALPENDFS